MVAAFAVVRIFPAGHTWQDWVVLSYHRPPLHGIHFSILLCCSAVGEPVETSSSKMYLPFGHAIHVSPSSEEMVLRYVPALHVVQFLVGLS